jgi:site-specific DNA-methyltransferase (adenine-specific)
MDTEIIHGDCLAYLKTLAENSIDLICTDPPYGYSFMGKDWDRAVPSVDVWRECLRVLKPGAFCCVMSAPRADVQCAMISRLIEAGFRLDFTPLYWTYASGFPKAMNVGKREPELQGAYAGFQPKPAVEVILVAMKPLSEGTFVAQALNNGKGISWLDDGRIPTDSDTSRPQGSMPRPMDWLNKGATVTGGGSGRFPANLLVSDDALNDGRVIKANVMVKKASGGFAPASYDGSYSRAGADEGSYSRYFDLDKWAETLPFLIVPKASKREKGATNKHPTVKPLKLMAYLVTLFSRPGDTVLDPFVGSGTTCIAAQQLGRKALGVERDAEYVAIAEARLAA